MTTLPEMVRNLFSHDITPHQALILCILIMNGSRLSKEQLLAHMDLWIRGHGNPTQEGIIAWADSHPRRLERFDLGTSVLHSLQEPNSEQIDG